MPSSVQIVVPTWSEIVYQIPLRRATGDTGGSPISFQLLARHTILNGNGRFSPSLIAWDSGGKVSVSTNSGSHWVNFDASTTMQGEIVFSRSEIAGPLTVPALPLLTHYVLDEAFVWPNSASKFARPQAAWQWTLGLIYLLAMLVCFVMTIFIFQKDMRSRSEGEKWWLSE